EAQTPRQLGASMMEVHVHALKLHRGFTNAVTLKKGRWAFNDDGVVLPSPSTSVEKSLAYFNSNDAQVQARFLSLLLATGSMSSHPI
ncbi:hypothetical protein HID58_015276, partial [Brassica napus]